MVKFIVGSNFWNKALLMLALIVALNFGRLAVNRIFYPNPLDVVEGFVVQQTNTVPNWELLYPKVNQQPALLTAYPPLFYLINHFVFGQIEGFFQGRLISLISLLVIFLSIFWLEKRSLVRFLVLLIFLFSSPVLIYWGLLNRVDMMAVAFSFLAILYHEKVGRYYWLISSLFLASCFLTKQSLGIPATIYIISSFVFAKNFLQGLRYFFVTFLAILIPLFYINHFTQGGLFFNLITANASMGMHWFLFNFFISEYIIRHTPLWFGLLMIFSQTNEFLLTQRKKIIYLCSAILMSLLAFKAGANSNYLIEAVVALVWLSSTLIVENWQTKKIVYFIFGLLSFNFFIVKYLGTDQLISLSKPNPDFETLANLMKKEDVILADDFALAMLPTVNKKIILDPFANRELVTSKKISDSKFLGLVSSKQVDLIVITDYYDACCKSTFTWHDVGAANGWTHWSSNFYELVAEHYTYVGKIKDWLIFRPRNETNL